MFVYVLWSVKYNRFYVGLTNNVDRRFLEHDSGLVKKTRFYRPFKLIHVEIVNNRVEARRLEKYFKSGYGREILKEIAEEFENLTPQ